MQDEHFIRQWNDVHRTFTTDLQHTLNQLGRYQRTRQADIGSSYGFLDKYAEQRAPKSDLSPRARASLRGLAASVLTVTLWVVVMALATPAPGLAASPAAPVANAECSTGPFLA
jgi:hypothetical protein